MDNAKHSRKVLGGTLVTSVLAVYLVAGADYSAFIVFLPQVHDHRQISFSEVEKWCFGRVVVHESGVFASGKGSAASSSLSGLKFA